MMVASACALSAESIDNPKIEPPLDNFDLVTQKQLKDVFGKPKPGNKFVAGKLSRDSYNSKQKGKLAKLLKEDRKGLGVAFFRTNGGNYGKLLYTWGVGPTLHLKEVVVFRPQGNQFLKSIAIGSAGHIDLDTGKGTHSPGIFDDNYKPDLHFSDTNGQIMFLSETDGARILFPI